MKKITTILLLLLSISYLTGCSTLPSPKLMKEEVANYQLPALPKDGKAIVYIVRPASLGMIIRFNVFVDSKDAESEMGYTRGGQYIYFYVEPGKHLILSKAENWFETEIEANENDIFFLQQEPTMGIIMARNKVFILQNYVGRYHVKHLELGTIIKTEK